MVLSASLLDGPTNDTQVVRLCDRIEMLQRYLPSYSICRCYLTQEKHNMLLKQSRLQHQVEKKLLKVLPAQWAQTDPRSHVPEVCQQALEVRPTWSCCSCSAMNQKLRFGQDLHKKRYSICAGPMQLFLLVLA